MSCTPWVSFTGCGSRVTGSSEPAFFPIIVMGRYEESGGAVRMPVALSIAHAVADGPCDERRRAQHERKNGRKRFMAVLREEEQQRRLACFFRGVPGSGARRRLFAGCGLLFDARERGLHEPCGGLCVELGQFRIEAQKMPQKRQKGFAN